MDVYILFLDSRDLIPKMCVKNPEPSEGAEGLKAEQASVCHRAGRAEMGCWKGPYERALPTTGSPVIRRNRSPETPSMEDQSNKKQIYPVPTSRGSSTESPSWKGPGCSHWNEEKGMGGHAHLSSPASVTERLCTKVSARCASPSRKLRSQMCPNTLTL